MTRRHPRLGGALLAFDLVCVTRDQALAAAAVLTRGAVAARRRLTHREQCPLCLDWTRHLAAHLYVDHAHDAPQPRRIQ